MKDYIYVSSKIPFGEPNANGDVFPELKPEMFVGKPVSINFDPNKIVGSVVSANLTEQQGSVEITMKVDKSLTMFPTEPK